METLAHLIQIVQKTKHGFRDIQEQGKLLASENSIPKSLKLASDLYESEVDEARMLAVFMLGMIAGTMIGVYQ